MIIKVNNFYSGTSGLILPVPNKEFYPAEFKDKSRLCFYGSMVNSIEINSSFYKIPMSRTVEKWAEDVPPDFKFTFKLSKEISHAKNIAFDERLIALFYDVINKVGDKKGCLLVQFPPSIRIADYKNIDRLAHQLRNFDQEMGWKVALEFRHASLYVEEVYELLDHYNMGLVIHDKGIARTPMIDVGTHFVYLRFHGPGGNYRGSYDDNLLYEYSTYIKEWLSEQKSVYVYFNNTMGSAHANLSTLRQMVGDSVV